MNKNEYFSIDTLNLPDMLHFLPKSLEYFLSELQPKRAKRKDIPIAAIGQCMMQLVMNKSVICPLQMALSADTHHITGNKYMVELINTMGFGSSYTETLRFEKCAAGYTPDKKGSLLASDIYSADNADEIVETIDGKNSLHITGMIRSSLMKTIMAKKLQKKVPSIAELRERMIPIEHFNKSMITEIKEVYGNWTCQTPMLLGDYMEDNFDEDGDTPQDLQDKIGFMYSAKIDLLRVSSAILKPTPRIAGFLRLLTKSNTSGETHEIEFLPFIDLEATDLSSTYTVLQFVIRQCEVQGQEAIITFDQPLWWQAMQVKKAKELKITILLGNFHLQMSFISAIGFVMTNSGLEEILATVYGDTTVRKMMAGKGYKRAMRGHNLLSTVLKMIILEQVRHIFFQVIFSALNNN